MSKLTETAKTINTVLNALATQVQAISGRQRVRKTLRVQTLTTAREVASRILDLVDALEYGTVTKKSRTVKATQAPLPLVNYVPFAAPTNFTVNTDGIGTVKGELAVVLVVQTPNVPISGSQPLDYTLANGESVKISKFARGTRVDLGNGLSTLPVLNRFLVKSTQPILQKLALQDYVYKR